MVLFNITAIAAAFPLNGVFQSFCEGSSTSHTISSSESEIQQKENAFIQREAFLDALVANMTIPEMVLQLHLMPASSILGLTSNLSSFSHALRFTPNVSIGVIHDLYPTNSSQYNTVQARNLEEGRQKIPFMQYGECLHSIGSFKGSMFPQSIGLSASFDVDLVRRVGEAIGAEARSIGIHACLSPVLDLGLEPRWGRVQEAWGEDMLLTSHMGVAMSRGLSRDGNWSRSDSVVPVVKHFAAHGSPQGGINGAPTVVLGRRQVMQMMLRPFKAVLDLGGARGVMMAYSELDGIPSHVDPFLYRQLEEWEFDGFVTADDTGMAMLEGRHGVAGNPAEAIAQWLNAGGMIQYYDYPLDLFLNTTLSLISNGTVSLSTLQSHVRKILSVKHDLGLFADPFIPTSISSASLLESHIPLTLEAAQKSTVLLENRNSTLPLKPIPQNINKIALIGPFSDTLNYGDYSGKFGAVPAYSTSTLRQAMKAYLAENATKTELVSAWGGNDWYYNAQRSIPAYLLSTPNGTAGGLLTTYYADTEFSQPLIWSQEMPNRDWGLWPPNGLPDSNFSVIWEGLLTVPVDTEVEGWLGVAVSPNSTAKLWVDGVMVQYTEMSTESTIQSNIPGLDFTSKHSRDAPAGGATFRFEKGAVHRVRLEYQAYNLYEKAVNVQSVNSEIQLFWNLVDRRGEEASIQQAVDLASTADVIVLAVGANWNSDGEGGDRSTLNLSTNQTALADAIFALSKPVILVLQGGRPFAIPEYYRQSSAVISTFFPGQQGGLAISNILFGLANPSGKLPMTIPRDVGTLPVYYHYKATARANTYTDAHWKPSYPFGYGLSYTTFSTSSFAGSPAAFGLNSTIIFSAVIHNTGEMAGSHVPQIYLLNRVSSTTQPVKQLVAFTKVYLKPGESRMVEMELEADRYLPVLNRDMEWVLEGGEYIFVLADSSEFDNDVVDEGNKVRLRCLGDQYQKAMGRKEEL